MMLPPGAELGRRSEPDRAGLPANAVRAGDAGLDHQASGATPAISATRGSATAAKGETLFRIFSHDVVTFLERVIAWDGRSWDE